MHAPYYSTHGLPHQNPVIAHKGLQGAPILEYPLHYKDNLTIIFSTTSDTKRRTDSNRLYPYFTGVGVLE